MKLTREDYQTLVGFLEYSKDEEEAQAWLQMWFDEKAAEVFKEGWLEACHEYDVTDTYFVDDELEVGIPDYVFCDD